MSCTTKKVSHNVRIQQEREPAPSSYYEFGGAPNLDRYTPPETIKVNSKEWDRLVSAPARRTSKKVDRFSEDFFGKPRKHHAPKMPRRSEWAVAKAPMKGGRVKGHRPKAPKRVLAKPSLVIYYPSPFSGKSGPVLIPSFSTAVKAYQAMRSGKIEPRTLVQFGTLTGGFFVLPAIAAKAFLV